MTNPIHPGTRIKEIRESQRITANALAVKAGIDPAFLRLVERGKKSLGFESACKVADALGVPVEALRGDR